MSSDSAPTPTQSQSETNPNSKWEHLKARSIFRFPFTFAAMKWGAGLSLFFAIHTFVKTRNVIMSLSSWLTKTVLLTGLFFGYYFTKYSFYSESISRFQVEEMEKNLHADIMKRVIKLKLDIQEGHSLTPQEVMSEWSKYLMKKQEQNLELCYILETVDSQTFDL